MAQRQKKKKPKVAEAEQQKPVDEPEEPSAEDDAEAEAEDQEENADGDEQEEESSVQAEGGEEKAAGAEPQALALAAREAEGEEEDDAPAATQLGSERYVLAGFFAAGMLLAYVVGRAIETVWQSASNKDWFSQTLPRLAAVPEDSKKTYSLILGGAIALVVVLRAYRRPDLRTWTDEVASELAKVKWPSRKDVQNYTVIVIAASTVATLYLALLDRFWAFVTNIVYGDGS
jgi:preprotein translocase subunit SecE